MRIGIIGLGNIGKMLVHRLINFLGPSNIVVHDKKDIKIDKVSFASSNQEVIDKCDIIFICIRPQNLKDFFAEVKPKNKVFVTTVAAIYESTYYKNLGKISLIRIIPSMINKVGGPILFFKGKYTTFVDAKKVKNLISKIGKVYEVKENEIDAYTHLSSCLPAIVIEFLKLYIGTLMKEKKINKQKALRIVNEMLEILVRLFKKDSFEIISQVCTKGGITEQGIKIMKKYQNTFFRDLTSSLLRRMNKIRKQYGK